jgi:hypothetical protein
VAPHESTRKNPNLRFAVRLPALSLVAVCVNVSMTRKTERDQIFFCIRPTMSPQLDMVDVKIVTLSTPLARPTIPFQNTMPNACVIFGPNPHSVHPYSQQIGALSICNNPAKRTSF